MRVNTSIYDVGAVKRIDRVNPEATDYAESVGCVSGVGNNMPIFEVYAQEKQQNADATATNIGIEELASDTHDEVVPKNVISRTTAWQPAIRSMDEVIKENYRETIAQELAFVIRMGDIDVQASLEKTNRSFSRKSQYARISSFDVTEVYEDTLRFGRHMSFWRIDRERIRARFQIYMDVLILADGKESCQTGDFAADMWFHMKDDEPEVQTQLFFRPFCQNCTDDDEQDKEMPLDRFLIPYINKKNIETVTQSQLKKYFPEKSGDEMIVDPYELADRMTLNVMCLPLYKQQGNKSLLFFCEGRVRVQKRCKKANGEYIDFDDDYYKNKKAKRAGEYAEMRTGKRAAVRAEYLELEEMGNELVAGDAAHTASLAIVPISVADEGDPVNGKYEWVKIPPKTIVINMCVFHRKERPFRVFHECFHYEFHYPFYRLQAMSCSDVRTLKKSTDDEGKRGIQKSLGCMEWQANRGSFSLAMPVPAMQPKVQNLIVQYRPESKHEGYMYESVGCAIAERFDTRKYRARARLIQMGQIGAAGALNFKDGGYIKPFAFDHSEYSAGTTWVIGRKEVRELYKRNEGFRELFDTGEFAFVDGHICRCSPEYVFESYEGLHMTDWANEHVDQCCLRFDNKYVSNEIGEYSFGWLACNEDYVDILYEYLKLGDNATTKERIDAKKLYLKRLPSTFPLLLGYLRQEKGYSQDKLSAESGISKKTIARWERGDAKVYALEKVVLLCFALKLPPWLSSVLMKRARVSLDENDEFDEAVQELLDTMFNHPVDEIQSMLQKDFERCLIGDLSVEQDAVAHAV